MYQLHCKTNQQKICTKLHTICIVRQETAMQGVCTPLCCAARRCKCVHKCIQKKSPSVTVSPSQPNIIIVIFIISVELVLPQIVKGPTHCKKLHNNCYRPCETFVISNIFKANHFFSMIGCNPILLVSIIYIYI